MSRVTISKLYYAFVWFAGASLINSLTAYFLYIGHVNEAKELHSKNAQFDVQEKVKNLEFSFSLLYDTLNTMAHLPGVQKIDRYGKTFSDDARITVQQIYNSLASHVNISEIYIVPADLDPERFDPVTKQLQAPIITFDEIIVGRFKREPAKRLLDKDSHLEEEEIFEYREMVKQMKYFKNAVPHANSSDGLFHLKAHLSEEVITCDNSEFSKTDLNNGNNYPRLGFIYSVPFYDLQGKLKGMVSAILRTKVLEEMLGADVSVGSENASPLLQTSKSIKDSFYTVETELNIPGQEKFLLAKNFSNTSYMQSDIYRQNIKEVWLLFTGGMLLTTLSSIIFGLILLQEQRAKTMANSMLKELDENRKQLFESARLNSIAQMCGGISHEINNPLAIIKAKASLIKRQMKAEELDRNTVDQSVKAIEETCLRVAKIIKSMRMLSHDGSDQPMEPHSVNEMLESVFSLCREKFRSRGIEIKKDIPKDLIIDCRQVQIEQVFLNLLNNSFDALHEAEKSWIEVGVKENNGTVTISFTDSGNGIPPDIADKIMMPFFTTKDPDKGTGLGLSISNSIISSHKGTFSVDQKSPNTKFDITLPIENSQNETVKKAS